MTSKIKKILKQQFVGWKIKTEQSFFDDSAVTLMDILPQDQKNFSFGYILPYDSKHALVEYTAYSEEAIPKENLKASLNSYLEQHLQNVDYSVYFEETGAIPMSTQYKTVQTHERWIPIGTRAGWSRPSTGYTFQFIQEHCQKLVNELESDLVLSKKINSQQAFFLRQHPAKHCKKNGLSSWKTYSLTYLLSIPQKMSFASFKPKPHFGRRSISYEKYDLPLT